MACLPPTHACLPFTSAEDRRVVLVANHTLKVHPVPVILWANGYTAFIQRTNQK